MLACQPLYASVRGSPFYEFEQIVAEGDPISGDPASDSYPLSTLYRWISVNNHGRVAFGGEVEGTGGDFDFVVAANDPATGSNHYLNNVLMNLPSGIRNFRFEELSIADDGRVMASRLANNANPLWVEEPDQPRDSIYPVFDANAPGQDPDDPADLTTAEVRFFSASPLDSDPMEHWYNNSMASMADDGSAAFILRLYEADRPASDPDVIYTQRNYAYSVPQTGTGQIGRRNEMLSSLDPPMAGDDRRVVYRDGSREAGVIQYRDHATGTMNLTEPTEWDWVGQSPGISGDGVAAVWYGSWDGVEGVYLRIIDPSTDHLGVIPVITVDTTLNFDDEAEPIYFANFGYGDTAFIDLEPRVNVLRHDAGNDGLIAGDTFIVSFIATPEVASRSNPSVAFDTPLLFSDQAGIWTARVTIDTKLGGSDELVAVVDGALPVIQIGDLIDGQPITDLYLWDSLGAGLSAPDGTGRTPEAGDHYLAFRADTAIRSYAIRANHLDDDGDGLLNHWEKPGGGIDMDRDGIIDLSLAEMGAQLDHKDLFLEIDWLAPRASGIPRSDFWHNEPTPTATQSLVDMFAAAPISNPDGNDGITLHIDAGSGEDISGVPFSKNMGSNAGLLQGGDLVTHRGARPDIIYFGTPRVDLPPLLDAVSLHEVKDRFFGTADRRARELAFRYCILADFEKFTLGARVSNPDGSYSTQPFEVGSFEGGGTTLMTRDNLDLDGDGSADVPSSVSDSGAILFVSGVAQGRLRRYSSDVSIDGGQITFRFLGLPLPVTPAPGDRFVVLGPNLGTAEMLKLSDLTDDKLNYRSLPGNDMLVTSALAPKGMVGGRRFVTFAAELWRTAAHELGHNLSLRHGGCNTCRYKGDDYLSLMSYSHSLRHEPTGALFQGLDGCEAMPLRDIVGDFPGSKFPVLMSFSDGSDNEGTDCGYSDWENIMPAPWRTLRWLGNTHMKINLETRASDLHPDGLREKFRPAADAIPPKITLFAPVPRAANLGGLLAVEASVTDNVLVDSVEFSFDINGDGDRDDAGEVRAGTPLGGNLYGAAFPGLAGADEARALRITATDSSGNLELHEPNIWIGPTGNSDLDGPILSFFEPFFDARVPRGGSFGVWFSAEDLSGVVRATVRFDLDGDGSIDPATEEFPATYEFNGFSYDCDAEVGSIAGPEGGRQVEIVAEDPWGNVGTQNLTVQVRDADVSAPMLTVQSPADGEVIGLGELIEVRVQVTDDEVLSRVQGRFDADGDGSSEIFSSVAGAGDLYTITLGTQLFFPPVGATGPEGMRSVVVEAEDESGNLTTASFTIDLQDRRPPQLMVNQPAPDKAFAPGTGVVAEVQATDEGALALINMSLDLNGDGDRDDPGETITPTPIGDDNYSGTFGALSGPLGERRIHFTAEDATGKSSSLTRGIHVASGGILLAPGSNGVVAVGGHARVFVQAVEGLSVDRVEIRFDSDGNGSIDPGSEIFRVVPGTLDGSFEGAFAINGGTAGSRDVAVEIFLTGGGSHLLSETIEIVGTGTTDTFASEHKAFLPQIPNIYRHGRIGAAAPHDFISAGGNLFFLAGHQISGAELWRSDGTRAGTFLLRDIDPNKFAGDADVPLGGLGTAFDDRAVMGDKVIFVGNDSPISGFGTPVPEWGSYIEPWVSDGTPDGTHVLKDIWPGRENSSRPASFEAFRDEVWFKAEDERPEPKIEMWKTDGTEAGTVPALPGLTLLETVAPDKLTAVGNTLFFLDEFTASLWKSDGTEAGTEMVLQIDPGGSAAQVGEFVAGENGMLFFTAGIVGVSGWELWRSDGTAAGTFLLKDIAPPSSGGEEPEFVGAIGTELFFTQFSSAEGRELWKSDGTIAGTVLVADIREGTGGSEPGAGVLYNGHLYFPADDGLHGSELWRTDGTAGGTELFSDLFPGAAGTDPGELIVFDGKLFFVAAHPEKGRELWVSEGTPESTVLAVDLVPGAYEDDGFIPPATIPFSGNPQQLTVHGGRLYFAADDPHYRSELWVSDGTPAGTHRMRNIEKRTAPELFHWNGDLYLNLADGSSGYEPHRFDGSGLQRLADHHEGPGDAHAENFRSAGTSFVYAFVDSESFGTDTHRLGSSDGTPGGTQEVPTDFAGLFEVTEANGGLIYFRGAEFSDRELWRTDGSVAGTLRAKDIFAGFSGSDPLYLTPLGNRVAFSADDFTHGRELWVSDGSEAGTNLVMDFFPGFDPGTPRHLFPWNGELYFSASTGFNTRHLWKSDGTAPGTIQLSDAYAGTASGDPAETAFVEFDNELYYSAAAGVDVELWRTDGTPGGTEPVKDLASGGPQDPSQFAVVEDQLFFTGRSSLGVELWVTDGTAAGTQLTRNIAGFFAGFERSSEPQNLMPLGDKLVFTAYHPDFGRELWISDGTLDGTDLLIDLFPGPFGGLYRDFVLLGDEIYFTANDGERGRELWKTDGTIAGTRLVEDLLSGAGSSNPESLVVEEGVLWYVADTGADNLSLRCLIPGPDYYQEWLDEVSSLTGANRALYADPNGNALINLFEYAGGGDPDNPGSPGEFGVVNRTADGDLVYSFPRRRDRETRGLIYILERSDNLGGWTAVDLSGAEIQVLSEDFERVDYVIAAAGGADPLGFFRLRVIIQ